VLGLTGLVLALTAILIGTPAEVKATTPDGFTIGLDWFVLNLLLLTVVFIPLERAFPLRPGQKTFRFGWATDGIHYLISHLAVQTISFLTLLPATSLAEVLQPAWLHQLVRGQPLWVQFIEVVFFADLFQYWAHRAFHTVPILWRMHAVHHSSQAMDWLAGSRLHIVDVLVTRGLVLVPVFLLGFAQPAFYAYVVFVAFHAVFIHANVRFRFGWLDYVVTTPRGHHWHHAVKPVDTNFAVHLPLLDRLFGTLHLPGDEWPQEYGISGPPVPEGWLAQQASPFRKSR
jgi:lathosterol oxidase